jgi:hypothetical protein
MYFKLTDKETFMKLVDRTKFRYEDEVEIKQFGIKNVQTAFSKIDGRTTRWALIVDDKDNNNICAFIALPRDGYMSFFTNINIKHHIAFIKELKNIVNWYTDNYETTLFTRTANWYKEAIKINKIVGFKPFEVGDTSTLWIFEKDR